MLELFLFLLHCLAAFSLLGIGVLRLAQMTRMRKARSAARKFFVRGILPVGGRVILGLSMLEAASGLALLAFAPWRESGFSVAMLMLVLLWGVAWAARRAVRRDPSGSCLRTLILLGWVDGVGRLARAAILILIALV